jgi:hypothetical protein
LRATPVGHQTCRWHRDELGDEQLPLLRRDPDAEQFLGQFLIAVHLGAGAGDRLLGFLDAGFPGGAVDEGEGGAGPLAFQFGGAEGVGAHDPDRGRPESAGGGAVVPVGDGQVRQRRAVIPWQGDGFVEQGQAPDGPAAVEYSGGLPTDVGLGQDRLDDLAHLPVADHGVGVAVDGQDRAGVGAADGLPAFDLLVDLVAVGVDAGAGVDLGGDGVPVQSGQGPGFSPGAGVAGQDGAFAVPGHLPDREHGFDVGRHANTPFLMVESDCV